MHQQYRPFERILLSPNVNQVAQKAIAGAEWYGPDLIGCRRVWSLNQGRAPCVRNRNAALYLRLRNDSGILYHRSRENFGKKFIGVLAFPGPSSLQMNISAGEIILPATATEAVGLVFRERMAGGFALGETDPREGERKGRASHSYFVLQATAAITNLSRFVADLEHAGTLTGSVRFAPLGDLEIRSGLIQLFRRTESPTLKLMEYRFALRRGTSDYYLVGQKEIRKRRLLQSWSETTTLYCRLYEGPDARGVPAGAGVLHLTPWEFLKQLSTFHVTNARSIIAKAGALLRFGRFFAAELLDSYL